MPPARLPRIDDPRTVTIAMIAALSLALWWPMFAASGDMQMQMDGWSAGIVIGTSVMWVLMMLAMMLPAMSPMLASYARLAAKEDSGMRLVLRVALCGAGYFVGWAVVSVVLALVQLALRDSTYFTMGGTQATPIAAAFLMLFAGVWQLTPVKDACLAHCRHPVTFLIAHWREGISGAFSLGVHHGLYCVGCCVAIMGLMFVFGAMNVIWMASIAAYFVAEKVLPHGEIWGRWVGIALILAGIAILVLKLV